MVCSYSYWQRNSDLQHYYNEGQKLILTHGNSPQDTRDEARDDDLRIDDGLIALCYGIDAEVGRTGQQYATVHTK